MTESEVRGTETGSGGPDRATGHPETQGTGRTGTIASRYLINYGLLGAFWVPCRWTGGFVFFLSVRLLLLSVSI